MGLFRWAPEELPQHRVPAVRIRCKCCLDGRQQFSALGLHAQPKRANSLFSTGSPERSPGCKLSSQWFTTSAIRVLGSSPESPPSGEGSSN